MCFQILENCAICTCRIGLLFHVNDSNNLYQCTAIDSEMQPLVYMPIASTHSNDAFSIYLSLISARNQVETKAEKANQCCGYRDE